MFASLRSIITERLLGMANLTSAYGLLMLFMGLAALVGSPIAGALADATGSPPFCSCRNGMVDQLATHPGNYDASFYVMGILVALSGLISFPLLRLSQWEYPHLHQQPQMPLDDVELQVPPPPHLPALPPSLTLRPRPAFAEG